MTLVDWLPKLEGRHGPKAIAIADAIGEDIASGRLKPGDKLPPHRDLAFRLGVSVGTVTRSYAEAQRRGLVSGQVGSGTYVGERTSAAQRFALWVKSDDGVIDLSANIAVCDLRQMALDRVLARLRPQQTDPALLEYQGAAGMERHRQAGARWITRPGFAPDPARVVITHGAQQALALVFSTLVRPGATVLCEDLTFPPVKSLASVLGLRLHGVALDQDGLRPDALDEACRSTGATLLYTIPTFQNPTGIVFPEARRRELAEIARRRDIRILEDDVYAHIIDSAPPPLAAFAPERTWYVDSVSKTLAPGLRVGYLVVPEGQLDPMLLTMRAMSWMTTPIAAEIATLWMEDGTADELVAWHRRERVARAALAREILGAAAINRHDSPHLWLTVPERQRGHELAAELTHRGVRVAEGDAFAVARDAGAHAVRISLNAVTSRDQLARALRVIYDATEAAPASTRSIM